MFHSVHKGNAPSPPPPFHNLSKKLAGVLKLFDSGVIQIFQTQAIAISFKVTQCHWLRQSTILKNFTNCIIRGHFQDVINFQKYEGLARALYETTHEFQFVFG